MILYGYRSRLQEKARDLFENYHTELLAWKKCKFEIISDSEGYKKVCGTDVIDELIYIKKTLDEMNECLYEYYDEYIYLKDETYMVFDMGEYCINEDRWWIYEYEIKEYLEVVDGKLKECDKMVIKLENDLNVSAGIAIALLRL